MAKDKKAVKDTEKSGYELIRTRIKETRIEFVALSAAVVILGIIMISFPDQFNNFVGKIVGGVLCVWGLLRCFTFIRLKSEDMVGSFALVQGAAMIGFGIYFLVQQDSFRDLLDMLLTIMILVLGVLKLQHAINFRKLRINGWQLHLLLAVLLIAVGTIAIIRPEFSDDKDIVLRIVTIMTGAAFVISGIWDIISVTKLAKVIDKTAKELEKEEAKKKAIQGTAVDKPNPKKNVKSAKAEKKAEKKPKNSETVTFSDPELDEIDNLDYGDDDNKE